MTRIVDRQRGWRRIMKPVSEQYARRWLMLGLVWLSALILLSLGQVLPFNIAVYEGLVFVIAWPAILFLERFFEDTEGVSVEPV